MIDQTNVRVLAAMNEAQAPVIVCEVTDARRVSLRGWQSAREALYRRAATVVAPDQAIADWFCVQGAKARAIPNPLLPPRASIPTNRDSRKRVITLSRLSAEKRPEWLLRAFASLIADHADWDLEFHGLGPQTNTLEHLAEKLAPTGRIKFCGFTNDAYAALTAPTSLFLRPESKALVTRSGKRSRRGVPVVAMDAGPSVGTRASRS